MRYPHDGQFKRSQGFSDPCCRASYAKYGLVGHNGWDIAAPLWTPLYAPHDGKAKEVIDEGSVGYGKYVKVESDIEGSTIAHLAKFSVNQGQDLKEGDLIGYSGNSGNSTGPHYHWGYYRTKTRNRDNGFNGYIDQTDWLNSAIIAQPITQEFLDQTIIPKELLNWFEDLEIQQIRGLLKDLKRLQAKNEDLTKKLQDCGIELSKWQLSPQKPLIPSGLSFIEWLLYPFKK